MTPEALTVMAVAVNLVCATLGLVAIASRRLEKRRVRGWHAEAARLNRLYMAGKATDEQAERLGWLDRHIVYERAVHDYEWYGADIPAVYRDKRYVNPPENDPQWYRGLL